MSLLNFSVSGKSESPTRLVAKTRQFSIVVDEPPSLGGSDEGANPVEYLLASYAGCLNVVAHLVAKEKGIEMKGLAIEVSGDLDPARLFGEATSARAGYQYIKVTLKPETDAHEQLLAVWLEEVERRCPINDNLSAATPVTVGVEKQLPVGQV